MTEPTPWGPPLQPPPPGSLPVTDEELLRGPAFDEEPAPRRPEDWWADSGLPDQQPPPTPLVIRKQRKWRRVAVIATFGGLIAGAWWLLTRDTSDGSVKAIPVTTLAEPTPSQTPRPTPPSSSPSVEVPPGTSAPAPATSAVSAPAASTPASSAPAASTPAASTSEVSPTTVATSAAPVPSPPAPPTTAAESTSSSLPSDPPGTGAVAAIPPGAPVVLAGGAVIELLDGTSSTPLALGASEVAFAFPDGRGVGVIHQRRSAGVDASGAFVIGDATDIIRVRPDGTAIILYPAQSGRPLRLHDVRLIGGSPVVLYSVVREGQGETLLLSRPVDGSTIEVATIIEAATSTDRLHLGNGLVVGERRDGLVRSTLSLAIRGGNGEIGVEDLQAGSWPLDCVDCPASFSVDAAGLTIAWLEGSTLVIAPRDRSSTAVTVDLPDRVAAIGTDIRIGKGVITINPPPTPAGPGTAVIVDLRSARPTVTDAPQPGFLSPL